MRNKHFPFYLQHDSMQCGATCLRMICKYYGKEIPIILLSKFCSATTEGVSLLGINTVASNLKLQAYSGRLDIESLCQAPLPCILHWNQNHFVVLYKVKNCNTFYVADPGKGLVKYCLEEFKKHWISTKSDGEERGLQCLLNLHLNSTRTLSVKGIKTSNVLSNSYLAT